MAARSSSSSTSLLLSTEQRQKKRLKNQQQLDDEGDRDGKFDARRTLHHLNKRGTTVSSTSLTTTGYHHKKKSLVPTTTASSPGIDDLNMEAEGKKSRTRKPAHAAAADAGRPPGQQRQHQRRALTSSSSATGNDGGDNDDGAESGSRSSKAPQEQPPSQPPHILGPRAREALVKSASHHVTEEQSQQFPKEVRPRQEKQVKEQQQREDRPVVGDGPKRPFPHPGGQFQPRSGAGAAGPRFQTQLRAPKKQVSERWKASVWSKAGISTTVLLRDRLSKRTLLFDCGGMGGVSPSQMSEAETVFVSHAHADHCGGLFAHARSRFAASHTAKYLVPKPSIEQMKVAKAAFEEMDGHELKMEFVGVEPGMTIDIGKGLTVECVPTEHRVPSVGFLIYRSEKHIKPEYASLSGEEKADLAKMGIRLSETVRVLEIAYSGDTTAQGLDPRMFQAQLCIVECTFVTDKEARLARDTQHVLLSELEQIVAACEPNPNCQLLLMHFSARYSASQITAAVRAAKLLPRRTACALAAFNFDPGATDDDAGISFA